MSDPGSSQLSRPSAPERCRVEQDRHLRRQGTTPVEARWHRPWSIGTVRDRGEWHGGGLAGEDDLAHSGAVWRQPPPWRVRPVLVPHCLLGKPPSPARQANLARHVRQRRAPAGQLPVAPARTARVGDASGGGRRVGRCAARCAGRPYEIQTWLPPLPPSDGSRHGVGFAAAVSMACNCLASSASISPIATRSSGLMNPSDSRNPPARAIASLSGTAQ